MSIEAMKQALMQLNRDDVYLGHRSKTRADAITLLKKAIEQAEDAVAAERKACAQVLVDKAKDMSLYLDLPCAIERDENGKAIDGKPTRQERINTLFVASKLILARDRT